MTDCRREIQAAVEAAREAAEPLYIRGGDSKRHLLGRDCPARELDLSAHRGVVDYQPGELVITARAGTPLREIRELLALHGQWLPSESPCLGDDATLGGTIACNLSGPARPFGGSIRDLVLGVELVNGCAEVLRFGGKVMKNVAGYDVSRLQSGALGTLGAITEASLKVLPRPEQSLTLAYEMDAPRAVKLMNRRAGEPKPLSAACWVDGRLYLRLSGAAAAVNHTARLWGGEPMEDGNHWDRLREMTLPFFAGAGSLWRLSVDASSPVDQRIGLIDWCGAQRWLLGDDPGEKIRAMASAGGGHACLFRGGDRSAEVRQEPSPVEQRLQLRLKQAFDPDRVFNPGRLYSWM